MVKNNSITIEIKYKYRLFRRVFSDKASLLSLYNAVNNTSYVDVHDFEVVTLDNAIYMNMKNDVAFLMCDYLNMYEHQSTYNPNVPLRNLFYISREYESLLENRSLYGRYRVSIPTPKFIVFYNGTEERLEREVFKLSDLYTVKQDDIELELKVLVLNINPPYNERIKEQCKLLSDYTKYVDRVRKYANIYPIEKAVTEAVNECIREDILKSYLVKYQQEAINLSIFEYNEAVEMKKYAESERQGAYNDGVEEGKKQGIKAGKIEGIKALILDNIEDELPEEHTIKKLKKIFELTEDEAIDYYAKISRRQ